MATDFYRQAWLVVAREGWQSASEILAGLPDFVSDKDATTRLWYMSRTGYFKRRPRPKGKGLERLEYGVTLDCLIPMGLTAAEVSEALIGRRMTEEVK